MSAVTSQAPSTISSSTKPHELDIEPDEQWKTNLRTRIEEGLKSMVQDAKDNMAAELRRAPVGAEERERLTQEYTDAMTNIRKLAAEAFQTELERERQERRWASGQAMLPQWSQALMEEQQDIMDRIKKSSSNAKLPAPVSDVRPPIIVPKSTPREIPPPMSYPIPELPAELQKGREEKERREREQRERERERERDRDRPPLPVHTSRRGSDTHVSEYSQTFRHATYNLLPGGLYNEPLLDNEFTDEPEELLRPPERYRSVSDRPPIHDRAAEAPVSRSIERQPRSLSDRHTTHSPPKPIPEVWKPAITPEDDARMSKPFPLGRRGSTASIRSTGSGGIRPSIAEAIPERADDMIEITQQREKERERVQGVEQERGMDKIRERERSMSTRNEGRQSVTNDHSQRYDDTAAYGRASTRPPDHHSGIYGPPPRPVRHQTSFSAEEREYASYAPHPAPQRPLAPRTSFNNDERPYLLGIGPYPAPSPARPISHKPSFTNDDHDRYHDPPPSRPYPTPPSSASRGVSRDYGYQDGYDPRADNSYRDREPRSNTWKVAQQMPDSPSLYRRSSESRPMGREPSFRSWPDAGQAEDSYSTYEYPAPTSSIPISRSRQSPISDDVGHNWKGWAEQPPARPREYRYEQEYQRPPYSPEGRPSGPRSPPSSYQGHRDATYHNFGGRSMHEEREEYFENDSGTSRYYRETRTEPRRREQSRRGTVETFETSRQEEGDAESDAEREAELGEESDAEVQARAEAEKRREDEVARKEEEARRKEEEAERKEEEVRRKEEETRKKEEEMRRKEEEAKRKEEETRKKAEIAEQKALDAKKKEEEARRKEEEARRKEEEAERKEAETKRKEKEIRKKEQEVRRKEVEAKRMENEAKIKEEETKRREADALRKETEAKKKEEDARKREAAAKQKSAEAAQKEKETQKKEDEIRAREEELRRREEELARREEESNRKETERKQREEEASIREAQRLQAEFDEEEKVKAADRRREEERNRREFERRREDDRRRADEDRLKMQQQEEFRKREEEIRRRADERKRQDSVGAESAWAPQSSQQQNPLPRSGPQRNGAGSSPSTERNGPSTSSWSSSSSAAWGSSTTKASTASSSVPPVRSAASAPPPPAPKPRAGSTGSSFPTSPSPNPSVGDTTEEEEWQNRQNDYSWRQQEKFREEQAAIEAARLRMGKGKILSKEEVLKVFARHEQQWESLKVTSELRWRNFPWPMIQPPSTPEDIAYRDIEAYIQSPHYPEGDKAKASKDRIREQLRNWHPDRFDTKYLPKVIDEEKAVVKEGAGSVVRILNELLQRINAPGRSMWD
ncbi:hypothetical protein BDZ94DRAFT_1276863 [Collybia nuda]|uniref:Uncharacterized protein n=1 Tax=Collybia nuda TaxID=64659 RepID=A0A9P6CCC9_9AGAR|nr:hypothetical protein BDZ94DRAFT_1276863 [Collybia nuda]